MILNKKSKKYLKTALGVPLAYGTTVFVAGKLPGQAGQIASSALAPAVGTVGLVSNVAMLGVGYETAKQAFKFKKLKGGKKKKYGLRI